MIYIVQICQMISLRIRKLHGSYSTWNSTTSYRYEDVTFKAVTHECKSGLIVFKTDISHHILYGTYICIMVYYIESITQQNKWHTRGMPFKIIHKFYTDILVIQTRVWRRPTHITSHPWWVESRNKTILSYFINKTIFLDYMITNALSMHWFRLQFHN